MSTPHPDVTRARRGSRAAFTRLVQRYAAAVLAITTAVLGDRTRGEDAAQDAFAVAWQRLPDLRDPSRFASWLAGIARRRALDALRRTHRRQEVGDDAVDALVDAAASVPEQLDAAHAEQALWAALDALEPNQREVLDAYYRRGDRVAAIASRLALPEATVRKRLSRGRARLREDVADRLGAVRVVAVVTAALAAWPSPAVASPLAAATAAWRPGRWLAAGVGTALGIAAVAGIGSSAARVHAALPPVAAVHEAPAPVVAVPQASGAPRSKAASRSAAKRLPLRVRQAFLAAEDARFYEHDGVDLWAAGRAAASTASGQGRQGGSTITQQLAKQMLIDDGLSGIERKIAQTWLAWRLESVHNKDALLDRYLESVYLGRGAVGVAAAAQAYFQASPADLTLGQRALLAGLPAAPTAYDPRQDRQAAAERRRYVLDRLHAQGWASAAEIAAADAEPLPE